MYDLPTTVLIDGVEYDVETDYRAILDIFSILADRDLTNSEKGIGVLGIFFKDFRNMPAEHFQAGIEKCFEFINCGDAEHGKKAPKLMDWEQDFKLLIAPINRVAGTELRAVPYVHWWTFLSYYYEIGDCFFAQIVRIRDLKARGKKLDKQDREFYLKNREAIDFKTHYSKAEEDIISNWT